MMGRKHREQANLFYEFRLDDMIPEGHLLRRINVFVTSVLGDLHEQLGPTRRGKQPVHPNSGILSCRILVIVKPISTNFWTKAYYNQIIIENIRCQKDLSGNFPSFFLISAYVTL
jgi:hypothetical protein